MTGRAGGEEVWVSIATMDRPASFAALCDDLARQATSAGVSLRLLIVDNSRRAENRASAARVLEALQGRGIANVRADSPLGGESIAASRLRQRELIRDTLRSFVRPRFVWMLDDDVRLAHIVWTGDALHLVQLHNHLAFLLELGAARVDLDVLIGEVNGDPPVPVLATLATRFADLLGNLTRMFASHPDGAWEVRSQTLELLRQPDSYYDLSVERSVPAWTSCACWLPRRAPANITEACAQMLGEVGCLPFGIAFSRPILAEPHRFSTLVQGTRRGGNAVFFDVEACLDHSYPSMHVAGVETRRSDMIGACLLASRRRARVMSSGFSVLHTRPRETPWPSPATLYRTLLADTLGACLAREVQARLSALDSGMVDFRRARMESARRASSSLKITIMSLSKLADHAPAWVAPESIVRLRSVLDWGLSCTAEAPDGFGLEAIDRTLTSKEVSALISRRAAELVQLEGQ